MVRRILSIHFYPLKHTWSVHSKHLTIMPSAIIFCPFWNSLTSPIMIYESMVPLNLPPSNVAKPETVFVKKIGTSFRSILLCSITPYQLLTFLLIRFTLIEVPTWHITINPSWMNFVSRHCKRLPFCRTHVTLDKRSRELILLNPHFFLFLFMLKKKFHASFGNQLYLVEPSTLFHINVGIIVMPGDSSSSVESFLSAACAFVKYFWAA